MTTREEAGRMLLVQRDHFTVLLEDIRSQLQLVAEGHVMLAGKIDVMQSDLSVVKADVATLKVDVSVLKSDVAVLKEELSVVKSDVSVIKTTLLRHDGRLGRLEANVRRPPPRRPKRKTSKRTR